MVLVSETSSSVGRVAAIAFGAFRKGVGLPHVRECCWQTRVRGVGSEFKDVDRLAPHQ